MSKIIVSPSLLACDFMSIKHELDLFDKARDIWFHLDIMDGHFVPNLTFGHPIVKQLTTIAKHPLDAHLMVANPEFYIDTMKDLALENFTFHFEACKDPLDLIKKAKSNFKNVGLSIKPNTPVNVLDDGLLKELDLVLIMSVEPGFGGQKFMPSSLEKVKWLKQKSQQLKTSLTIQIDGGIDQSTAPMAIEAGCHNLVAGSYIFKEKNKDYIKQIQSLRD